MALTFMVYRLWYKTCMELEPIGLWATTNIGCRIAFPGDQERQQAFARLIVSQSPWTCKRFH